MTFAWYGHLNYKTTPLAMAVMVSWGIAFFEYWLAVPANRIGHQVYSAAELKIMQEVITLTVFAVFSTSYLTAHLSAFRRFYAADRGRRPGLHGALDHDDFGLVQSKIMTAI